MSSKYPSYSHSTFPKTQLRNAYSERASNQPAISHPPVFHYPNPVAFKDVRSSYQSSISAQSASMKHAVSTSSSQSSQQSSRLTSMPFGNHDSSTLQSASILPTPSSISKNRHPSRINKTSSQSHSSSKKASTTFPASDTETIIPNVNEYDKSIAMNVVQSEPSIVLSPYNESIQCDSEMVSVDGIVMLESDGEFAYSTYGEEVDDYQEQTLSSDKAFQTRCSHAQPNSASQQISSDVSYGTSSNNEEVIDDLPTPPMRYTECPIIPKSSSHLSSTQSVGCENQRISRKRKFNLETEAKVKPDVQPNSFMESETRSSRKKTCRSSDVKVKKVETFESEDLPSASIATQITHCYLGDLITVLARLKYNIQTEYLKEFRSKSINTVKAEHEAIIVRLVEDSPFKKQPNKAPVFIRNCLASIVACLRYGMIYDFHQKHEPLVSNFKANDLVLVNGESVARSSATFIYTKCFSHLERISKDFDKAFEILRAFDKRGKLKEVNAMKDICKLALIAAKACLSANIYHSWVFVEENKRNSTNMDVNCQKVLTNGGFLPLDEGLSFGQSDSLCQPLIPDNPSSNASHDTQQQTPASTVSQRSSENGAVVKPSSISCFADVIDNFPSLRVSEYLLRSEELWNDFKSIHNWMSNPLSSCSEQTKEFEFRLLKQFPWSLGQVDAYRDESTLILCLLESIQSLLCGWLAAF